MDDPEEWLLPEVCLDQAALDAHRSSVHVQEIVIGTVLPLLESRTPRTYPVGISSDPGSGGIDGS
jgi:quinol monooxygenase YgiN